MECLNNIIGISRTENPCFTDDFSAEAEKSTSGLYLDELEGFPSLNTFKNIAAHDQTTLQKVLEKAREDAVLHFTEELYRNLGTMYTVKSDAYVGHVGNSQYNSTLNISHAQAGLVLDMQRIAGAEVTLTGIKPFFNYTGTVTVKLYKAYNTGVQYQIVEELAEYTLNTHVSAPQLQEVTNISLPTTDEAGKPYSYILLYEMGAGQPRDNKNTCGCGEKENIMHQYLRPYGVMGTDADNLMISNRTDKINGLQVQVQAICTGGDFVCQNYYSNPMVKKAIEYQIWRKAGANAIVRIITTDLINYITLAKREQLGHTVNILNSIFKKNMLWVAENINVYNNDCFSCNHGGSGGQDLTRGGIML